MIILPKVPTEDIIDGLLVRFEKGTDTNTEFAFTDIHKGQREYTEPNDPRTIKSIYVRL